MGDHADIEALAKVAADIRTGRFNFPPKINDGLRRHVRETLVDRHGPLIDSTFIYDTYRRRPEVAIYEDHPTVAPPWELAYVGYRNEHGNANVTVVEAVDWDESVAVSTGWAATAAEAGNSFAGARWALWCWTFGGGRDGTGRKVTTTGPIALTKIAVDADGVPLDIGWSDLLGDGQPERFDWPRLTVLGVYSFLAARNVELVDAPVDRACRRRMARAGHQVSVLAVAPSGTRRRKGQGRGTSPCISMPLHSVRGHWAHYGQCCPHHEPRGLLFGRYTGRVWVPQTARGQAETGSVSQVFVPQQDGD